MTNVKKFVILNSSTLPDSNPYSLSSHLLSLLLLLLCLVVMVLAIGSIFLGYTNWDQCNYQLQTFAFDARKLLKVDIKEETRALQAVSLLIPPPPPPPETQETLLLQPDRTNQQILNPAWLEEIQNNKIFSKQKQCNQGKAWISQEISRNHDDADGHLASQDDILYEKENSRTESAQDC